MARTRSVSIQSPTVIGLVSEFSFSILEVLPALRTMYIWFRIRTQRLNRDSTVNHGMSRRYRNLCDLSRGLMQIRIRYLSRAALETVQRATHAFAAPIEDMGIDHRGFDILVA